jgi:DNA polymerase III epsilon subunit family exonuclease
VNSRAPAPYTAFDLETTGLFPGVHRIVEIGAVSFAGDTVIGRFQTLVDPGVPMPEEARRVNGITDEMLRGQPSLRDALPRFVTFLGSTHPVAHNARFDAAFLRAAAAEVEILLPLTPVLDTRLLAMAAFPRRGSYSLDSLRLSLGLNRAPGRGACPPDEGDASAHRALADAEACRRLFLRCAAALERRGTCRPEELAALYGTGAGFGEEAPERAELIAEIDSAIRRGDQVEISYLSARGERTERLITPLSLSAAGGALTVEAYCHLRGEGRTFRISGIQEVRPVRR